MAHTIRVCTTHHTAADVINGVLFASVDGVRISETLTPEKADEFLRNATLFRPYEGKDDGAIDRALDNARATKAAAINRVQDDAKQKLEETRAALRNVQGENQTLKQHIEELQKRPSDAALAQAHSELQACYADLEKVAAERAARIAEVEATSAQHTARIAELEAAAAKAPAATDRPATKGK
jgi:DNA repair exonuclease SbcCD ATPase subunit